MIAPHLNLTRCIAMEFHTQCGITKRVCDYILKPQEYQECVHYKIHILPNEPKPQTRMFLIGGREYDTRQIREGAD